MSTPIQDQDIIHVTQKIPAEGRAEGTWYRPDGSSFPVTVIKKSSLSFLARCIHWLRGMFSRKWITVDTGTHFLLFNKTLSSQKSKPLADSVKSAFKHLRGEMPPPVIEGEKSALEKVSLTRLKTPGPHIVRKDDSKLHSIEYTEETNTFSVKDLSLDETSVNKEIASTKEYLSIRDQLVQNAVLRKATRIKPVSQYKKIGNKAYFFKCWKNFDATSVTIFSMLVEPPAPVQHYASQIESLCKQAVVNGSASIPVLIGNGYQRLTYNPFSEDSPSFSLTYLLVKHPTGISAQKEHSWVGIEEQLRVQKSGLGEHAICKMQQLLEQADEVGEASVFVSLNDQVFRATLKKDTNSSFTIDYSLPQVTEKLSDDELAQLESGKSGLQLVRRGSSPPKFVIYSAETNTLEVRTPEFDERGVDTNIIKEELYVSARAQLMLEAEEAPSKEATRFVSIGEQYVRLGCQKDADGRFIIASKQVRVEHKEFPREKQEVFDSIMSILQSGKREGKVSKPALLRLLEQADKEGKGSVFVTVNNTLYRAIVTKKDTCTFDITYTEPLLTEEDLQCTKLSPEDAKYLKTHGDKVLHKLFNLAIEEQSSHENKRVKILLQKTFIQMHIKADGTITVGMGTNLGVGSSKIARKIVKGNLRAKVYVEATPIDFGGPILKQEAQKMEKFAGPNILKIRKYYVKTSLNYLPKTGQVYFNREEGIKSEFCDGGTAESLFHSRPKNLQERLQRLSIVRDAAQGLAHIHHYSLDLDDKGAPIKYAHMDFKPANLFLKKEGKRIVGIVGDVAPIAEGNRSATTPSYGDWEIQHESETRQPHKSSQANDVWALGITLVELMYGEKANPFLSKTRRKEDFEKAHQKLLQKLGDSPEDTLIKEMLVLDRTARPQLTPIFLQKFEDAIATLEKQLNDSRAKTQASD
jgi:hypothetical protein